MYDNIMYDNIMYDNIMYDNIMIGKVVHKVILVLFQFQVITNFLCLSIVTL